MHAAERGARLLHAALVDALLAQERDAQRPLERMARRRALHLQQRVVHEVLAAPHLARAARPARSGRSILIAAGSLVFREGRGIISTSS